MKNNACPFHRGKVIGGSSVINGMLYLRGSREDFDEWARLGNPGEENDKFKTSLYNDRMSVNIGWSFDEVLPFFKLSEDNRDYSVASDTYHHSVGGLLPVQKPKFITPVTSAFLVIL